MLKLIIASLLILPIAFGQTALTTAQIAKTVSPSVVVIQGNTDSGEVLGSGFIVSKDGKIVTNLHVIRDMKTASVQLATGEVFDSVSVLATDERRDLAVVQIAGFNLPVLELGNSDALTVGEPLVIVGSPRGLEGTVTAGILSSVRDTGEGFKVLQTDAAVNPGNSGGPVVNTSGQAIGVVSFKLRSAEGLNFAVPINYVRGLLNNLDDPMTLEQIRRSLTASRSPAPQVEGPPLKETLDWLREKIPLGIVRYSYVINGETEVETIQSKAWSLDSCTITIGYEMTTISKEHPDSLTDTFRYQLPLGIINGGYVEKKETVDPAVSKAVLAGGERWEYIVHLTGTSNEVLLQIFSRFSNSPTPNPPTAQNRNFLFLHFDDDAIARRVLEAFRHAADLCRNKEPF